MDCSNADRWLLTFALLLLPWLAGCGPEAPFELASVRGKVVTKDGSFVEADQLLVKFVPQGIAIRGKNAPRAAETYANITDGTFSDLTTWKFADGVLVGHHKVVVIALRNDPLGVGEPIGAVPAKYRRADTTPLEVEVTSGGENNFSLEIE